MDSVIVYVDITPPSMDITQLSDQDGRAHALDPEELGFFYLGPAGVSVDDKGKDALGAFFSISATSTDAGSLVTKVYCLRKDIAGGANFPADITYPFYSYKDNLNFTTVFGQNPASSTYGQPVIVAPTASTSQSFGQCSSNLGSSDTGLCVFTVVAEDLAGNIGTSSRLIFLKVDTTAPNINGVSAGTNPYDAIVIASGIIDKDVTKVLIGGIEMDRSGPGSGVWVSRNSAFLSLMSMSGSDMKVYDYAGNSSTQTVVLQDLRTSPQDYGPIMEEPYGGIAFLPDWNSYNYAMGGEQDIPGAPIDTTAYACQWDSSWWGPVYWNLWAYGPAVGQIPGIPPALAYECYHRYLVLLQATGA